MAAPRGVAACARWQLCPQLAVTAGDSGASSAVPSPHTCHPSPADSEGRLARASCGEPPAGVGAALPRTPRARSSCRWDRGAPGRVTRRAPAALSAWQLLVHVEKRPQRGLAGGTMLMPGPGTCCSLPRCHGACLSAGAACCLLEDRLTCVCHTFQRAP